MPIRKTGKSSMITNLTADYVESLRLKRRKSSKLSASQQRQRDTVFQLLNAGGEAKHVAAVELGRHATPRERNRYRMRVFRALGRKKLTSLSKTIRRKAILNLFRECDWNMRVVSEKMKLDKSPLSRILNSYNLRGGH